MIHTASNIFSNDESMSMFLKTIDDITLNTSLVDAAIVDKTREGVVDDKRRSKIAWIKDKQIRYELWDYVNLLNSETLALDLWPFCVDIQYAEYDSDYKGHFDWHTDVNPFEPSTKQKTVYTRKYSASIMLSQYGEDYEGGKLEFKGTELADEAYNKGSLILFPSPLMHRVTPVTKGLRRVLVLWFHGPSFR